MQCKDETIAVLEDIEEAQFDECDDCFDDHTDAGSRAEENDVLEVLEVQPGHDIPGVHMPPRLQQLRGNALISGLPRDEQIFNGSFSGHLLLEVVQLVSKILHRRGKGVFLPYRAA